MKTYPLTTEFCEPSSNNRWFLYAGRLYQDGDKFYYWNYTAGLYNAQAVLFSNVEFTHEFTIGKQYVELKDNIELFLPAHTKIIHTNNIDEIESFHQRYETRTNEIRKAIQKSKI